MLKSYIKELLAKDKILEAIVALQNYYFEMSITIYNQEIIILENRFQRNKKNQNNTEAQNIEHNKIILSLIQLADEVEEDYQITKIIVGQIVDSKKESFLFSESFFTKSYKTYNERFSIYFSTEYEENLKFWSLIKVIGFFLGGVSMYKLSFETLQN